MTASLPALSANAVTQKGSVNVTIDQKVVTVDEAKAGVLIYVKVDTPLLNAIEFGTHVDDQRAYTYHYLQSFASMRTLPHSKVCD